jgi:hypothetical protein
MAPETIDINMAGAILIFDDYQIFVYWASLEEIGKFNLKFT